MSHDGGSSCKSYIKHPTEKERLDNLAFTSFPEDYLPYTSSYHRKAPYLVWDDGFRPHRKRRLKRWRESRACRCCTAAALTAAISLIIIGILSIVAVSIYLGVITSLFRSPILSLSGKMTIVEGDEFTDSLLNTTSYEFLAKAEIYQAMLENVYLSSSLEPAFVAAKVYAFRKGNLTVFFRIYLDRRKLLHTDEETLLIAKNVVLEHAVKRRPEFSALSLDLKSIEFRENNDEEQSPEMDFGTDEESQESGRTSDEETEHSQFLNHPPGNENLHSGNAHQTTTAQANVNSSIPISVEKMEEPNSTPDSHHVRASSDSTTTITTTTTTTTSIPSHTLENEKTLSPERLPSEERNVSISYGQWQPLVPVLKTAAVEASSTKRPPLKDHRRIPGSGAVHLVEESIFPVISHSPATRNTPLPGSSEISKPQPNVASTIMSSVSLVILPSSKNRTVTVTNNKNKNVIETAVRLPLQQSGDLKLPDSLLSDSERESETGDAAVVGTRNSHASLRFIEDFDRNINSHTNERTNKTDRVFYEGQKTSVHPTVQHKNTLEQSSTTEESSKFDPWDSKVVESALSGEPSHNDSFSEQPSGGHDDIDVFTTLPVRESFDVLKSFSSTNEHFSESVTANAVSDSSSVTTTRQSVDVISTNHSQHANTALLQDFSTKETSVTSGTKMDSAGVASVSTYNAEGTNLKDDETVNERAEPKTDYEDTVEGTTDILTNFRFYVAENDTDSSGFLDIDALPLGVETENPQTNVTELPGNPRTTTEIPSFNFSNDTVVYNESLEVIKIGFGPELTDSHPSVFLSGNLPENNDSDLSHNITETTEINSAVYKLEEKYNGSNSSSISDTIGELEANVTTALSLDVQHSSDANISTEESALNGSKISDLKAGGLPKIVPPFANTQYIPNDIHSDTDVHKQSDNNLDDELHPFTYSDVDVDLSDEQPTSKPQTEIEKDHQVSDFQPPDDENVVIHHITTAVSLENDSVVVGLGKYPTYFLNKCSDDEIICGSGECIPADYKCNMRRDCRDNSDEDQCFCADNLKVIGQTQKICDGIQDCWDLSDEENCPWCAPGQFICPQSKLCIEMNQVCDGSNDCPFGTDEKYCVILADDESRASSPEYQSTGYLMIRKQGQWGKLCLENLHSLAHPENLKVKLGELGHAVCSALSYKEITEAVETKDEVGTKQSYFEISTQPAKKQSRQYTEIFQPSQCQSKSVVHVTCKSLECGMRPMAFSPRRRIVGGHSANSGSWPWQVALYKEGDFQCGAVLVSDVWLISAGHCFYSSQNSHWTARLGVLRRGTELPSPSEQVRRITHIFIHPDYVDKGFINDIALLRMDSPVPFSDFLRPICLPNETEEVSNWHGHHCSVVGWGKLYEIGHTFPDSLQEVRLPVISTEECRKKILFLTMYHLTDNMFCAGYERGGRDACLGDSGGPLMCQREDNRWVLLGVTSNGDGCGRPGRPGVYTKVTKYLSWINKVIEGDLPPERSTSCGGHRCSLGHCVVEKKVCDGRWDCSDGSDEINCFI